MSVNNKTTDIPVTSDDEALELAHILYDIYRERSENTNILIGQNDADELQEA